MKYSGTETGDETENAGLRFCLFLNSWCWTSCACPMGYNSMLVDTAPNPQHNWPAGLHLQAELSTHHLDFPSTVLSETCLEPSFPERSRGSRTHWGGGHEETEYSYPFKVGMIYMVQRLQEADAEYTEVVSESERIIWGCVWLSYLPKIVSNSHIISGTCISVVDATSSSDAALANASPFQSFQA